jgi:GTP:adenosylcobinamide-phosphate guanylyltransferase
MGVPAIVAAGDRRAAKAVRGESKPYLELAGRALVAHVVAALQRVPEVSEVWVVGNAERLEVVLGEASLRAELTKPLHIVPQFRNLYENAWETYRRLLPVAGPDGRDPGPGDADTWVLFLSADLPFATPHEISAFIRQTIAAGCDYGLGICTEESMRDFYPESPGAPGIRMAYFNQREGRFRQSNIHLVKPARLGNRHYIEDLYEHRYQRQISEMIRLGWTLLRAEGGGLAVIYYYALMHLAGVADRNGWRWLADWLRYRIPMPRIEKGCSALLRTKFRFIVTEGGGCAVDIDNEPDLAAASELFDRWRAQQLARVESIYGPLALSERATPASGESQ